MLRYHPDALYQLLKRHLVEISGLYSSIGLRDEFSDEKRLHMFTKVGSVSAVEFWLFFQFFHINWKG
eukprot:15344498-Ditylum_brightwellii.AAC.1